MTVVIDGTSGINTPGVVNTAAETIATTLAVTGVTTLQGLTVGKGAGAVATNTAVGASALVANTTGSNNTAMGYSALIGNTTGNYNTAFGIGASQGVTTGEFNTAVGRLSGGAGSASTGSRNSSFGNGAGNALTTGTSNSGFGMSALRSNTTGGSNTAVGDAALDSNTTASNNTAVGYQAGYSTTTGSGYNTFIGQTAGTSVTTGSNNVLIGTYAGGGMTTGSLNTFVGSATGGYGAGYFVTTGSKNTIIGAYNGNQGSLDIRTASNNIVLSDGDGNPRGYSDGSGNWTFGSASQGVFNVPYTYVNTTANAANVWVSSAGALQRSTSSLKYKTNVQDLTHGLADVLRLRAVTYQGKAEADSGITFGGLIAEEVHATGLTEFVQYAEDGSPDALAYGNMVALAFKAIQEQQALITQLQADVALLKGATP